MKLIALYVEPFTKISSLIKVPTKVNYLALKSFLNFIAKNIH
jgi:hypothetical protein